MPRIRPVVVLAVALAALGAPAVASAHVEIAPEEVPAGGEVRLDVRVPNERDDASTAKIELKLPPGFASARYEAVPGWKVDVKTVRLSTPVQTDDGPIDQGVDTITWTADSRADAIAPGAFQDFPIAAVVPGKAGTTLTFKALQTYTDGDIVRWIGSPDSDNPAATVKVVSGDGSGSGSTQAEPAQTAAASSGTDAADDGGNGLATASLFVGVVALLVAAGAFAVSRRRAA
jgi:periplasmic copper chaperone A